jgi:hypothetical protein
MAEKKESEFDDVPPIERLEDAEGFRPVFVLMAGPDRRFKWQALEGSLDHGMMATAAIDFMNTVQTVTDMARGGRQSVAAKGVNAEKMIGQIKDIRDRLNRRN